MPPTTPHTDPDDPYPTPQGGDVGTAGASGRKGTESRGRYDATVVLNHTICREHYLLRLRIVAGFPQTRSGQFVQLGCRHPDLSGEDNGTTGYGHEWEFGHWPTLRQTDLCAPMAFLRRPFSLAGRGDDDQGTWIDVIHRVVGVGTDWLSRLKPGDVVDLIGPLGNWFSLPQNKSIGLLVGGGVGLPPMFYLAEAMRQAGWSAVGFIGATTADLLAVNYAEDITPDPQGIPTPCVDEFARHGFASVITTDDGSVGLHGRVTRGLEAYVSAMTPEDAARTVVYVCGPEPMMHAVAGVADAHGLDCQVCLEQAMACGMGTCQSCVVKIEDHSHSPHAVTASGRPWRYRLACTDGPIFHAPLVVWQG